MSFLLVSTGCDGKRGAQGYPGAIGPPDVIYLDSELGLNADLPGLVIEILEIKGGTGQGGNLLPGDTLSVRFKLTTRGGRLIYLEEMDGAAIMVSGPTESYQRILPQERDKYYFSDVKTASVANQGIQPYTYDGTYTYTFSVPIPSTYPPQIFDTVKYGSDHGELKGQALKSGTYTVGMRMYKNYTISGIKYMDAGNITKNFLLGSATTLDAREVTKNDNCNQCHLEIRAHGGEYKDVKMCALCHTAGAEDWQSTDTGDATNISIDFRIMIHKIHNGFHLPSVNGVGTKPDGTRDYTVSPLPYQIAGYNGALKNFSEVKFPLWPNMSYGMLKDQGWSLLNSTNQAKEDAIRMGVTGCEKCHGDPDGAGSKTAPTQGGKAYSNPTRYVCQSCHDDWDPAKAYIQNAFGGMPAQPNDSQCSLCHAASGAGLSVPGVHTHPLYNSTYNPGIQMNLSKVDDGVDNQPVDPNDGVRSEFTITNSSGTDIPSTEVEALYVAVNGPSVNKNFIHYVSIPPLALPNPVGSKYTITIPRQEYLEYVGSSTTAGGLQTMNSTKFTPWNYQPTTAKITQIRTVNTSTGRTGDWAQVKAGTTGPAGQNYVDIDTLNNGGATLKNGAYVVFDWGGLQEEYLKVGYFDTSRNRLWFSSPYSTSDKPSFRYTHVAGVRIDVVNLNNQNTATGGFVITEGTHYSVNYTDGKVTELQELGDVKILLTYYTPFLMPATYPLTLNDSVPTSPTTGFDESWGKWAGKTIESGTYTLGLWAYKTRNINLYGETNSYRGTSLPAVKDFLVGTATTLLPRTAISSGENCHSCHGDVLFHGGSRRGYETCLLCHGLAGAEDRALYAQSSPDSVNKSTSDVTVDFRTMLHRIHKGKNMSQPTNYKIIGFGDVVHTYEKVSFPAIPDGVKNCILCHGSTNAVWKNEPEPRDHSTQQTPKKVRVWRGVCGSCHNSSSAFTHFDLMSTTDGRESCGACHGPGSEKSIEYVHKTR